MAVEDESRSPKYVMSAVLSLPQHEHQRRNNEAQSISETAAQREACNNQEEAVVVSDYRASHHRNHFKVN